jgi:hypothetical protein
MVIESLCPQVAGSPGHSFALNGDHLPSQPHDRMTMKRNEREKMTAKPDDRNGLRGFARAPRGLHGDGWHPLIPPSPPGGKGYGEGEKILF